jgi:phage-related protein
MAYSLTWDTTGYDFSEEVEKIELDDNSEIATELVPRRHGALVTEEVTMSPKKIFLVGQIVQATAALAETRLSLLMKQMNAGRKQLRFNSARYINCYKEAFEAVPVDGTALTVWRYSITFFADDPFFYSTSDTSVDQIADYNPEVWTHTNSGDGIVFPTISIIADQGGAISGGITLTNSTTGLSFTFSATIANTKSLVVDCANHTVKNDGVTDFASAGGSFHHLVSGSNNFSYAGSAGTVRIAYTQRFFGPTVS